MALEKEHPQGIKLVQKSAICFRCGKKTRKVLIEKGARVPPLLCKACRNLDEEGHFGEMWCQKHTRGVKVSSKLQWKSLEKGTDEWEAATALIRPPRGVVDRKLDDMERARMAS